MKRLSYWRKRGNDYWRSTSSLCTRHTRSPGDWFLPTLYLVSSFPPFALLSRLSPTLAPLCCRHAELFADMPCCCVFLCFPHSASLTFDALATHFPYFQYTLLAWPQRMCLSRLNVSIIYCIKPLLHSSPYPLSLVEMTIPSSVAFVKCR